MRRRFALLALIAFGVAGTLGAAFAAPPAALDVLHYDLTLEVDASAGTIRGDQTIRFASGVDEPVAFDLTGLQVDAVTEGGTPIRFEREGDALRVPASRSARPRTIRVSYHGKPTRGLRFSADPVVTPAESTLRTGPVPTTGLQAYTVFNTWGWMVARTDPSDRATLTLRVILAGSLDVVGTGRSRGSKRLPDGRVQHTFELEEPHPAYLFGFAAGSLATRELRAGSVRLVLRAPAGLAPRLQPALEETARMLRFFEDRAGLRFPGASYTQVFLPGAPPQEMAGLTLLSTEYAGELIDDPHEDWLLAHELAHQWWGNRITCADWGQFWLNEGVATFLAAAWKEQRWGRAAYDREMRLARERLLAAAEAGRNRPLVLSGWRTPDGSGGTIPYQRGALFLDRLRQDLGEDVFWAGLRSYTLRAGRMPVQTDDIRRAFEQVSGRDLSRLFEQWTTGSAPEHTAAADEAGVHSTD